MIFNGEERDYLTVTRGRKRPAWSPYNRELITVPGMPGGYLSQSQRDVRTIIVPVFILADDFSDLQKIKEDMAGWLIHDTPKELIFKDEPERIYYALVDGELDLEEMVRWGKGEIAFICPDPFKYGPEKEEESRESGIIEVINEGTADAEPVIELTAKEKATFAMISNGADEDSEYNLIGEPADDDVEVVDARQTIYSMTDLDDGWKTDGVKTDSRWPDLVGSMQHDGSGMRPKNFGSGDRIHGPGVIRELDETLEDFEINAIFDVISERDIDNFRLEIDFFDENMNIIGTIGIKDNTAHENVRVGLGRVGPYRGAGKKNGYIIGEDNYTKKKFSDNTLMHMKLKREGNEFYFKIGRWRVKKLNDVLDGKYRDTDNEYMGKLKYVQVLIGSFGTRNKPARVRINKIDVIKLTQVVEDQTPYIIYPGDTVTFDHSDEDLLLNGDPRNDLKNFGATFFNLNKGKNTLVITPSDTFDAKVVYRDKYL